MSREGAVIWSYSCRLPGGACISCRAICKPDLTFLFLISRPQGGNSPREGRCRLWGSCIRNKEFGPLPHVTCVPSRTDESSLCTYHFRLTMELVQPREPTSSLGKSGNIKLMMRVQVAWYFHSLWLSVLSQPNAISQNEAGCPQRIARFPPNILRVCAGIHLYVLPKSPNNTSTCCWHFKIHQICWVTGSKCKSSLDLKNRLFFFFSRLYITLEAFPVTQ